MTLVTAKPLLSFFVLAYGLSWAYWIPLALAGIRTAPGSTATHEPGLLGPALAAFIVTGLTQGRVGLAALARRLVLVSRPTWRFLAYSLSPVVFLGLAIAVSIALGAPLPPWSDFAVYSGLPPLELPAVGPSSPARTRSDSESGLPGYSLFETNVRPVVSDRTRRGGPINTGRLTESHRRCVAAAHNYGDALAGAWLVSP